jgi:solute carrier family 13 (sodium-dependent dicarboxylate transporter), member 2/3/5
VPDRNLNEPDSGAASWRRWALLAGPLLAVACWWLSGPGDGAVEGESLSLAGRATLAMLVWMAVWWITEAADLTATALLPLCLFPLLGIVPVKEAAYADPIIFLFMGGFMVAQAMQRWGLARRVSLLILLQFGTAPRAMTGGMMLVTGLFSMFVSNTATTAMMLPIVMSIVALWDQQRGKANGETGSQPRTRDSFATCLLLGTAWAASIGGMATIIGTPPNTYAVSFLAGDKLPVDSRLDIGFASWLLWGLPCAALMLVACWSLLVHWQFRLPNEPLAGGRELLRKESGRLGSLKGGELATAIVFAAMVALWIARPWLQELSFGPKDNPWCPLGGLDDSVIAMTAGVVLFLIPARRRDDEGGGSTTVIDWKAIQQMPFGTLLLFGGGLSLANAVQSTGVDLYLGSKLELAGQLPVPVLIFLIVTAICLLSEIAGNLAVTVSVLPVLAALEAKSGLHPGMLCIPATLAASCGFMLPVATPPNAIVFATGRLRVSDMMRAGFALDLVSILIVTLVSCTLVRAWLTW